jgi:hypothetical protein
MARVEDDIPPTDEERALAERGRALVAAAMADPQARAPQALRDALAGGPAAAAAARAPADRRRSRAWRIAPALGLLAVAVLALVFSLGGSNDGPGAPSVRQVAAVARMPASAPAPAAIGGDPALLDARVGRLAFPDWRDAYEWRAIGRRDDRVGDRAVTTVAYRYRDSATIGYAIVAGRPVGQGPGREVSLRGGRYRVSASAGRRTVTWTQAGHTCVIDAPSTVSATELVKLASWA